MPLDIINFEDLKALSGIKTVGPLKQWLTDSNIYFWTDAKGKPVTIKEHLVATSKHTTNAQTPTAIRLPPQAYAKKT